MNFKTVYTEERPEGKFYAEDHGAGCLGIYFIGKRCRKPKYIATADHLERVKARIQSHVNGINGAYCSNPQGQYSLTEIMMGIPHKYMDGLTRCVNCGQIGPLTLP